MCFWAPHRSGPKARAIIGSRWLGPAVAIAREGRSNLWISFKGKLLKIAAEQVRRATPDEVLSLDAVMSDAALASTLLDGLMEFSEAPFEEPEGPEPPLEMPLLNPGHPKPPDEGLPPEWADFSPFDRPPPETPGAEEPFSAAPPSPADDTFPPVPDEEFDVLSSDDDVPPSDAIEQRRPLEGEPEPKRARLFMGFDAAAPDNPLGKPPPQERPRTQAAHSQQSGTRVLQACRRW